MEQGNLFSQTTAPQTLSLENGEIIWVREFYDARKANRLYKDLLNNIKWRQDSIRIAGKTMPLPRLQAWYGDVDAQYSYSGIALSPEPWLEELLAIKQELEAFCQHLFNSLLANLYRDGSDSVGWHADDEPELGINPIIGSLSLGGTRYFQFRQKKSPRRTFKLELNSGDLVIMKGALQHHWLHQVPKTRKACQPRINLTFRQVNYPDANKL